MSIASDRESPARQESRRRRSAVYLALAVLCGMAFWCQYEHRQAAAGKRAYESAQVRVTQMAVDARRIVALSAAPQRAADRQRPNDELLDSIRAALEGGGIDAQHWLANDPSPPVRMPQSAYKELSTRLSLERVPLRKLVAALHRLVLQDPTLTITRLRLNVPPQAERDEWNAEVVISYLMYSPTEQAPATAGTTGASPSTKGVRS